MIPGQPGYNDFWQLEWIEVPNDFVAGSVTSLAEVSERGFKIVGDPQIFDCPVVPRGTAVRAGQGVAAPTPTDLWYRGARVQCLAVRRTARRAIGVQGPDLADLRDDSQAPAPASGFQTAAGSPQTHNVVFSVPGDTDYSPLWAVHIYDRAAFDAVHDANTASTAKLVEPNGPHVNCPVIDVLPKSAP